MTRHGKTAVSRRSALKAAGAGLISVSVAGCQTRMTPSDARAAGFEAQTLTGTEIETLEALGETLVPGARQAGIAPYVDAGLTAAPADSLLMIRYLDVPAPWNGFYQSGLAALERFALSEIGNRFAFLGPYDQTEIVQTISANQPEGWSDQGAPPAPFFYFALRGDAMDVTWGTMAGFERFEQPYLAHIEPPTPW